MRNGLLAQPTVLSCGSVTLWPAAVRPPQVGGSDANVLPSKSF